MNISLMKSSPSFVIRLRPTFLSLSVVRTNPIPRCGPRQYQHGAHAPISGKQQQQHDVSVQLHEQLHGRN